MCSAFEVYCFRLNDDLFMPIPMHLCDHTLTWIYCISSFPSRVDVFICANLIFSLCYATFSSNMVLSNKLLNCIILQTLDNNWYATKWYEEYLLWRVIIWKSFNNDLNYFKNSSKWAISSLELLRIVYYTCHFKASMLTHKKVKLLHSRIC